MTQPAAYYLSCSKHARIYFAGVSLDVTLIQSAVGTDAMVSLGHMDLVMHRPQECGNEIVAWQVAVEWQ